MNNIREMQRALDRINAKQDALLDMVNSLIVAYAKQNNLATEDCTEECEYIDAT